MRNDALGMIALFTLAFSLAASPVRANSFTSDPIVVTVPFSFRAGETTLPAGTYIVGRLSPWSPCVVLQNAEGGPSGAVMTSGSLKADRKPLPARLVFQGYNGKYFLSQVWTSTHGSGLAVSKVDDELKLARTTDNDDTLAIVAGRK
jgi:hypothetical protein